MGEALITRRGGTPDGYNSADLTATFTAGSHASMGSSTSSHLTITVAITGVALTKVPDNFSLSFYVNNCTFGIVGSGGGGGFSANRILTFERAEGVDNVRIASTAGNSTTTITSNTTGDFVPKYEIVSGKLKLSFVLDTSKDPYRVVVASSGTGSMNFVGGCIAV